jgi:hypothetical protein
MWASERGDDNAGATGAQTTPGRVGRGHVTGAGSTVIDRAGAQIIIYSVNVDMQFTILPVIGALDGREFRAQ